MRDSESTVLYFSPLEKQKQGNVTLKASCQEPARAVQGSADSLRPFLI